MAGERKTEVRVAIACLYHEGEAYYQGSLVLVSPGAAKQLVADGTCEPARKR
jgi:hypothetical protein